MGVVIKMEESFIKQLEKVDTQLASKIVKDWNDTLDWFKEQDKLMEVNK